jgi:hypothetical protein
MIMRTSRLKTSGLTLALAFLPGIALAETPAPADAAQEEAFLDVLPKVQISDDVQPIPGAVNEEFRNCEAQWPAEYALSQSGQEARPYRDIYGYVKVRNVIATKDCTCAGKVATWSDVELIATRLREDSGKDRLGWQDTKAVFDASNEMFPIAEAMCGGSF